MMSFTNNMSVIFVFFFEHAYACMMILLNLYSS